MSSRQKRKEAEVQAARQRVVRNAALFSTLGIVVVGAVIALVVTFRPTRVQAPSSADPSTPTAATPALPAANLDAAADESGFRPTTSASVGIVENLPADTTLLAPSRSVLPVGAPAPDFTLTTTDGRTVRLSDYRGKTVLLEFFATWCPHCQAEAPHLLRIHSTLSPKDFAFISVNADSEDPGSIHAFERWFKIPWPALLDPGTPAGSFKQAGAAGPVTTAYGVGLYPTFYVIDPRGRVAWRNDREQPDGLLIQQLQNAAAR